jgi:hypothetical protein
VLIYLEGSLENSMFIANPGYHDYQLLGKKTKQKNQGTSTNREKDHKLLHLENFIIGQ